MTPSFAFLATPRPPTPPRDISKDIDAALSFLDTSFPDPLDDSRTHHERSKKLNPDTPPPSSPSNAPAAAIEATEGGTKRLRFSAHINDIDDSIARCLPPPKSQNPSRSILKQSESWRSSETSSETPMVNETPHTTFRDLGNIVGYAVEALAGDNHTPICEAYSTLSCGIRAYKDYPDTTELIAKLPLLEQYLKRDIVLQCTGAATSEKKLKIQALHLTYILFWRLQQKQAFSSDFLTFVLEESIRVLGDSTAPKEVVRYHLNLLNEPEIYSKALLSERVPQVLKNLDLVGQRITGKSVIQLRLAIYKRLVIRFPLQIAEDAAKILPFIFQCFTSSNDEVRTRSIDAAFTIASHIGHRRHVSQTISSLLAVTSSASPSYLNHFRKKLARLLEALPEDGSESKLHVPHIWGLVMLLAKSDQTIVEELLGNLEWLKIIERCFNSTNTATGLYAWAAWDRTILAASPALLAKESATRRLVSPILGHLQRKSSSGFPNSLKRVAYSSFYTMLYYSFGQAVEPQTTVMHWKRIVDQTCARVAESNPNDLQLLVAPLCALFGYSPLTTWNPERAADTLKSPLAVEDVPRIDAQWLRRNASIVLQTVEVFFPFKSRTTEEEPPIVLLWTRLMRAISQAGEKEIKASTDLKNAIASIINSIQRLCQVSNSSMTPLEVEESSRLPLICQLVRSSVEALGPVHFTETILLQSTGGVFEATATPSKTGSLVSAEHPCTPIAAFCHILATYTAGLTVPQSLRIETQAIIRPCLKLKPTSRSKISLLHDCTRILPISYATAQQRIPAGFVWQGIAELTASSLESSAPQPGTTIDSQPCSSETIIDIFEYGLRFSDAKALQISRLLFACLRRCSNGATAKVAYIVAAADRLLKLFNGEGDAYSHSGALNWLTSMLNLSVGITQQYDHDLQASTPQNSPGYTSKLDYPQWPATLYICLKEALWSTYTQLEVIGSSAMSGYLVALKSLIDSMSGHAATRTSPSRLFLEIVGEGLIPWIQDRDQKIARHDLRGYDLRNEVFGVWTATMKLITSSAGEASISGTVIEQLLLAAFLSRDKTFVDCAVIAWNHSFAVNEQVKCSSHFKNVVRRLEHHVNIVLPMLVSERGQVDNQFEHSNDDVSLFPWLHGIQKTVSGGARAVEDQQTIPTTGVVVGREADQGKSSTANKLNDEQDLVTSANSISTTENNLAETLPLRPPETALESLSEGSANSNLTNTLNGKHNSAKYQSPKMPFFSGLERANSYQTSENDSASAAKENGKQHPQAGSRLSSSSDEQNMLDTPTALSNDEQYSSGHLHNLSSNTTINAEDISWSSSPVTSDEQTALGEIASQDMDKSTPQSGSTVPTSDRKTRSQASAAEVFLHTWEASKSSVEDDQDLTSPTPRSDDLQSAQKRSSKQDTSTASNNPPVRRSSRKTAPRQSTSSQPPPIESSYSLRSTKRKSDTLGAPSHTKKQKTEGTASANVETARGEDESEEEDVIVVESRKFNSPSLKTALERLKAGFGFSLTRDRSADKKRGASALKRKERAEPDVLLKSEEDEDEESISEQGSEPPMKRRKRNNELGTTLLAGKMTRSLSNESENVPDASLTTAGTSRGGGVLEPNANSDNVPAKVTGVIVRVPSSSFSFNGTEAHEQLSGAPLDTDRQHTAEDDERESTTALENAPGPSSDVADASSDSIDARSTTNQPSASIARSIINRLSVIVQDARNMFLGPAMEREREELEDYSIELANQIHRASRRGRSELGGSE